MEDFEKSPRSSYFVKLLSTSKKLVSYFNHPLLQKHTPRIGEPPSMPSSLFPSKFRKETKHLTELKMEQMKQK